MHRGTPQIEGENAENPHRSDKPSGDVPGFDTEQARSFQERKAGSSWGHDPSALPSIMDLIDKELSQNSCTLGHSNEAGYVRQ